MDNDEFKVRNLYEAPEGKILYLIDFSGFELRIIAWKANERVMIKAFENGEDLHKKTAATLYGIEEKDVTKLQRADGKTGNFLHNYGGGPMALQEDYKSRSTRKTLDECAKILKAVDETYPDLGKYAHDIAAKAQDEGYVDTIYGYKRLLPYINSTNNKLKSSDERRAGNTPIQGAAADIMKRSQNEIYDRIAENKFPFTDVKMCAQVHDEIIFEVPDNMDQIYNLDLEVKAIMEQRPIPGFTVDVIAESSTGKKWGEKKDLKFKK